MSKSLSKSLKRIQCICGLEPRDKTHNSLCEFSVPNPPPKEASTGFVKHDSGKVRMSLVPPNALKQVAAVMTYGAKKYAPNNFLKGTEYSRYLDALGRHWNDYNSGENIDPESKLPHLAHIACNAMILLEMIHHEVGSDDRFKKESSK